MANLKLLKKRVLITGANGLLGQKLVDAFLGDFDVHGLGLRQESSLQADGYEYVGCDITNRSELHALVKKLQPDVVVNAAAYTHVDNSEVEKEACWKVNVNGVENIASAAKAAGAFVAHVSTDYVFDGVEGNYDEESRPNPLGYYGRSKLAGENALFGSRTEFAIARTMVLYGTGKDLKPNFATWLVGALGKSEPVNIVDDQYGHPTLVDDLAVAIRKIVDLKKTGVYHVTGCECDNRFNFALKLADVFGFDRELIRPVSTEDLNQMAPRPLNSSFNLNKLHDEIGYRLSGIKEGLKKLKKQL